MKEKHGFPEYPVSKLISVLLRNLDLRKVNCSNYHVFMTKLSSDPIEQRLISELQYYSDKANAQASFLIAIIFGTLSWLAISDQILRQSGEYLIKTSTIIPLGIFIALGIYTLRRFRFYSLQVDILYRNLFSEEAGTESVRERSMHDKKKTIIGKTLEHQGYLSLFYSVLMGSASLIIYSQSCILFIWCLVAIILALLVNLETVQKGLTSLHKFPKQD
jgi:hypothetical protein